MNRDTMTGSPFFSIGLTTYDRVDLLRESVQSVLAQSFGDFEIIIGNDGSDRTLTSADLQTDDPRIRIVNNEETLGQVGNWRALLGAARGTYFGWIADDDLYAPDLLKACHKALEGHGRPEGVFTAFTLLEGTDSTPPSPGFSGKIDVCSGHDLVTGYLLDELPLLGNMGFFRPNFLKNCVPWEQMECPGIALFREYLFVLGSIGAEKVLYLPDPLVIYRDHADSWGSSNTNVAQYIEAGQWLVEQGSHMLQAIADPRVRWQMTLLLFHLALRQLVQKRKNASFNLDVRGLMRDFLKADESSPADELSRRVYLALSGQYADAEVSRIEKEVEIHEKELEIHEKEVEIHEKELEIHEKEVEIHEMGAEASKRSLKVESLTEESGGLQDQLEATSAELKAISLEATRRQDQLEVATEEAENRQQIINKIQKTNQELIQTIDQIRDGAGDPSSDDVSERASAEAESLRKQLAEAKALLEEKQRDLTTFESTFSAMRSVAARADHLVEGGRVSDSDQQYSAYLELELQGKQRSIAELHKAVEALRLAHTVLSPGRTIGRWFSRMRLLISPRLGRLRQHPPIPRRNYGAYRRRLPDDKLPTISIVTPSFQQGAYIGRTIRSVLDQDYPHLDYVVQDGGSSDQTVTVLEHHAQSLTDWTSLPDEGQANAINLGFAKTSGEIMAWVNSDDLLLPGTLACVGEYFARHPDVDVLYGHRLLIDEQDQEIGRWIMPKHNGDALSWADFVPQETLFWRRDLWERSGARIDESYNFAIDWDMLIRFRDAGARFARIPRFLGAFRIHEEQKTSAAIEEVGSAEMDRIRERIHGRIPEDAEIVASLKIYLLRHLCRHMSHSIRFRMGSLWKRIGR